MVEEAAESTKLWCGVAVMAWLGGWRGRRAAASGLAALAAAQLVSNGVCKQVADRPRPPKEWFPHDEVDDRPDSSSASVKAGMGALGCRRRDRAGVGALGEVTGAHRSVVRSQVSLAWGWEPLILVTALSWQVAPDLLLEGQGLSTSGLIGWPEGARDCLLAAGQGSLGLAAGAGLRELRESGRFGRPPFQIEAVAGLGKAEVGVDAGDDDPYVDLEDLDTEKGDPHVRVDHQPAVENEFQYIVEAAGTASAALLCRDGHRDQPLVRLPLRGSVDAVLAATRGRLP